MEEKIKIYEKCNTNMKEGKEVWEIVESTDYKNIPDLSTIRILDIGCGLGNAFFHFNKILGTSNFIGFEMKSLSQIKDEEGELPLFWDKIHWGTKIEESKFLEKTSP